MQQGKGESATELRIHELATFCHQNDVEAARDELLSGVFLLIISQSIALLEDRNGERVLVEVDGLCQCEAEEGLRHGRFIKRTEAVI